MLFLSPHVNHFFTLFFPFQDCTNPDQQNQGLISRLSEAPAAAPISPSSSDTGSVTQLKATLLRTTLAKQSLEAEKADMLQRLEDLKRSVDGLERQRAAEEVLARHQRREQGGLANEVRA